MYPHARNVLALALALALVVPTTARAEEDERRPNVVAVAAPETAIAIVRSPRPLDLPARGAWLPAARRAVPSPLAPSPRQARLSEEGLVLVVAASIIGGVILIYLVSTATKSH